MVWFLKQMCIELLSFGKFLATKYMSLDNKPCMVRPFRIKLNPFEIKYYPLNLNIIHS